MATPNQAPDLYAVLGVPRDATDDEIRRAYRRLARELHPDVNADPQAEQRFKEVAAAYEVLSDPAKRRQYDMFGSQGAMPDVMGFDLSEIFDVFFGGGGFGSRRASRGPRRSRVHRGGDSHAALTLTFEQSVFGVDREIDIETLETCDRCGGIGAEPGTSPTRCSRCNGAGEIQNVQRSIFGTVMTSSPCPTCEGTGEEIVTKCTTCHGDGRARRRQTMTVEVPAGVTDGLELRIAGGGHAGRAGGPPGDLYVALDVQPHPVFERRGQDLFAVLEVPMTQAALGAEVEVPTLDGTEKVKLDAGTGNGHLVRLRGRGVPHLGRKARGDLFLSVLVTTPEPRSREERKLMEQIAQLRREPTGKGPHPATLRRPTLE